MLNHQPSQAVYAVRITFVKGFNFSGNNAKVKLSTFCNGNIERIGSTSMRKILDEGIVVRPADDSGQAGCSELLPGSTPDSSPSFLNKEWNQSFELEGAQLLDDLFIQVSTRTKYVQGMVMPAI